MKIFMVFNCMFLNIHKNKNRNRKDRNNIRLMTSEWTCLDETVRSVGNRDMETRLCKHE